MKHENYGNYPAGKKHLRRVSSAKRSNPSISVGNKRGISDEERVKFFKKQALNAKKAEHPQKDIIIPFGGARLYMQDIKNNCVDPKSGFPKRKIMPQEMPYKPYKESGSAWKKVGGLGLGLGATIITAWLLSGCNTSNDALEREEYRKEYSSETNRRVIKERKYAERIKKSLDEIEKETDYLTTEAYKNIRVSRIEQDPANWENLPMPQGAYWKDRRRILDIGEVQITSDKPILRIEQDAGSGTDLIGVKTGAGTFFGRPGKYIPFQLSSEEFENLRYDGYVHVEVGSYSVENSLLVRNSCYVLYLNRQVLYSDEAF